MCGIDWENVDDKIQHRVLKEAEMYMDGMLQAAISSDQRAATLGGIFIAASTAIFGGLLVYATKANPSGYVFGGSLLCALTFLLAAAFCLMSSAPADFHIKGNVPEKWDQAIGENMDIKLALGESIEGYQEGIEENKIITYNASLKMTIGTWLAIAAPALGAAMAGLLFLG